MIGMEIQLRNRLGRSQRHRHLQLCIPLVTINGPSYRLKDRLTLVAGSEPMT
jgi:hypothetical protein